MRLRQDSPMSDIENAHIKEIGPYSFNLDIDDRIEEQKTNIELYWQGSLRTMEDFRLIYNMAPALLPTRWEDALEPYFDSAKMHVLEKNTNCLAIKCIANRIPAIPNLHLDDLVFYARHFGDIEMSFKVDCREDGLALLNVLPPEPLVLNIDLPGRIGPECRVNKLSSNEAHPGKPISPIYYQVAVDMESIHWWSRHMEKLVGISVYVREGLKSPESIPNHSAKQIKNNYFSWTLDKLPLGHFLHDGICLEHYAGNSHVYWELGEDYRGGLLQSSQYFIDSNQQG